MVPLCNNQNSAMLTSQGRSYILRPPSHHNDVMKTLNEQRKKGDKNLCDVTLAVESSVMMAHKAVLASCSSYFKNRFEEKKVTRTNIDRDRLQRQASIPMSPPASPPIKRRRNAVSECIPETSCSPVASHSSSTPPPQSLQSRLRPALNRSFHNLSGEVVVLPGLKWKAFSSILDYMYTSELQINRENVQDLLLVSCLLQIKPIVDACVKILTKESNWKITTPGFRFNKKSPLNSSKVTSPHTSHSTGNKRIQSTSLLASPLRSSSYSRDKSASKNGSQENLGNLIEESRTSKESTCRRADSAERNTPVIPAHQRPRDDVIQLENQARPDSCEMLATGRVTTSAATSQLISQSVNQQLPSISKTDRNVSLAKEGRSTKLEFRDLDEKHDARLRRNRTMSDSTHNNDEALDLRNKRKQSLSDDETKKSSRRVSDGHLKWHRKSNFLFPPQIPQSSEIKSTENGRMSATDVELTQDNRRLIFSTPHTQSFETCWMKQSADAENNPRIFPSLDLPGSIFPSAQGLTSSSASPHHHLSHVSQPFSISNDTLKHIGFFSNFSAQLPNFVWNEPLLDRIPTLREHQSLNAFEALQICTWPNYFERNSVLHSAKPLCSQAPSNFPVHTCSESISIENKRLLLHSLPDGANGSREKITDQSKKQLLSQQPAVVSYERSKHPLKRKLMMSAVIENSESFRANSIEGELPPKSPPKPVSPTMSRFEPPRGPKAVVPSTRPQQCVI